MTQKFKRQSEEMQKLLSAKFENVTKDLKDAERRVWTSFHFAKHTERKDWLFSEEKSEREKSLYMYSFLI